MPEKDKKIWIIDDDEVNNLICTRIINEYDKKIKVKAMTSASEAIGLIKEAVDENSNGLPDVIFLDINMPLMNGWQFIDEYRKLKDDISKKVNLYMLTSSRFYQDAQLASKYGEVKELFTKPLSFNILDKIESAYL
ncbi:MAG: response regulator [Cyclobacteriaceae bacterium]